ncbi:MAG: lamin tail domain-containing protein [Bacteroidales bacterium]|jgi:hypothetical protein|nr:lamin tail domain-containing protein [Bacteroidales bacterium]
MKRHGFATILMTLCTLFAHSQQVCEDFSQSKIPTSYSTGQFVSAGGLLWNYVNARGNQKTTASGNAAASLNKAANACLFSDTIRNGIRSLSFEWEQALTTNCNAEVYINDSCVGKLISTAQQKITQYFELENIAIPGDCVIKIVQAKSTSGQITIDNICFEYAEKPLFPFELQQITHNENRIQIAYNYAVSEATIFTNPPNVARAVAIDSTTITIDLNPAQCGEFSIFITHVGDTSALTRFAPDTSWAILQFAPVGELDVVFSELMIAPSGEYGLPNYEYIELYNRSDCMVQLSDLELFVGTNAHQLPNYVLPAKSYVYIISANASSAENIPENVCFLRSFPALNNTSQTIALKSKEHRLITSLTYSDSWYASSFKKQQGGWSLEKIDLDNVSELAANWRASESFSGGTPGAANSVLAQNFDTHLPRIESVSVLNDSTIQITTNKNMTCEDLWQHCYVSHSNIVRVEHVDNKHTKFNLVVPNTVDYGALYQLFTDGILQDHAGNYCPQLQIDFARTDSLLARNAVIFTEILFHTSAKNEKFIELYNNSNSYFNCAEIYLTNIDTANNDVKTVYKLSTEALLFPPHSYAVVSKNVSNVQSDCAGDVLWIQPANMPSLAQSKGTLLLANKWGHTIDSLCYFATWHSPYLSQKIDVSLERLDYQKPTHVANNWYSAALSPQKNHSAGCQNSHALNEVSSSGFSLEKPNVHPAAPLYEQAIIHYQLPFDESHTLSIRIFSSAGLPVKTLANNLIPAGEGSITWDCTNEGGEVVDAGIYILHVELFRNGKRYSGEKLVCTVLH